MCHIYTVSHKRYMVHVGERGRFVLPAPVREVLKVGRGDLLVLDLLPDGEVRVRRAADVANGARGMFRDLAPGHDLAAELIEDRRLEAEREAVADSSARR